MLRKPTKAAINRFRKAVEAHAFMGSQPLDDRPEIKRRLIMAEAQLVRAIVWEQQGRA